MASPEIRLLGLPRLLTGKEPRALERRAAALLAFLALHGEVTRERLAGLLWPDTPEDMARANLRQTLHRLRSNAPGLFAESSNPLALSAGALVDVRTLLSAAPPLDAQSVPVGTLLGDYAYDELDAFAEWLHGARARVTTRAVALLTALSEKLEAEGDLRGAAAAAQRGLEADALCEALYQRLMKLHFAQGDRAAALAAYERCVEALDAQLGIAPAGETRALAERIRSSNSAPQPRARSLPWNGAVGPNGLIGRQREWAAMEAAWAERKGIILSGEGGLGKTRLMNEFIRSKEGEQEKTLVFRGSPADRSLPYGTNARTYRQLVQIVGEDRIPAWAKDELSRIIPGLGKNPGPLRNDDDQLRFWSAKIECFKPALEMGYTALAFDDVHLADHASIFAGAYVLQNLQTQLRTVHTFRPNGIAPELLAVLEGGVEAGIYAHFPLAPLTPSEVAELALQNGLADAPRQADTLHHLGGGNPMLTLVALRSPEPTAVDAPEASPRALVHPLLLARVARLSPGALQVARMLAVMGAEFSLERARLALEIRALELATAWSELTQAQLVRGNAFAHHLLGEAVRASTPESLMHFLSHQAGSVLADQGAPPALVAEHFLAAAEPKLAAPHLATAAKAARNALLTDAAEALDQQAARAMAH